MKNLVIAVTILVAMAAARGAQAQWSTDPGQQMLDTIAAMEKQGDDAAASAAAMVNDNTTAGPPAPPPVPTTLKPVITPRSGKVTPGTLVQLYDGDPQAIIFYTTDGTKPTPSSPRYTGPIAVHNKEKIRAMAFALNYLPSRIVTKTFKVKS